jgi:diketogulonate reductase-like aldo/keto reductase
MEQRLFGPTSRKVSVLGQGTWRIESSSRKSAIAALRRGIELGMTHIDTAEMYGVAEDVVGEAIDGVRDDVFLVSKILPDHASRAGTKKACEKSLARLKTDRLDCYLLHWRGSHPLAETIEAFERLRDEGKIRSWGLSNFDAHDLDEALAIAGPKRIACNQVLYHLEQRGIEHTVLPWCEKHGVALVAYTPFGPDRFPARTSKGGRVLEEIAGKHDSTPRQVALRFLLRSPVAFAIPKASRAGHTEENARAGDLRLNRTEIERIDEAFPRGPKPHSLPML